MNDYCDRLVCEKCGKDFNKQCCCCDRLVCKGCEGFKVCDGISMGENWSNMYKECVKTFGGDKSWFCFRDEDMKKMLEESPNFKKLGDTKCESFICINCDEITFHVYYKDGVQCLCKKHLKKLKK